MSNDRMLRSGPASEVLRSRVARCDDERQHTLDLSPACAASTYRAYNPVHGWVDKVDTIAEKAAGFAARLAEVHAIRTTGEANAWDAEAVNEHIIMIAREADALIEALILDAEARDLEASGRWMEIPLVECQKFQLPDRDGGARQ